MNRLKLWTLGLLLSSGLLGGGCAGLRQLEGRHEPEASPLLSSSAREQIAASRRMELDQLWRDMEMLEHQKALTTNAAHRAAINCAIREVSVRWRYVDAKDFEAWNEPPNAEVAERRPRE